ncbi:hypothetical protein EDB86DRAFT_2841091 [Lactarius hatsudake]|nr:hypothetical protein EDB86DRAFT_2841091 [Lactarius hatsudake]
MAAPQHLRIPLEILTLLFFFSATPPLTGNLAMSSHPSNCGGVSCAWMPLAPARALLGRSSVWLDLLPIGATVGTRRFYEAVNPNFDSVELGKRKTGQGGSDGPPEEAYMSGVISKQGKANVECIVETGRARPPLTSNRRLTVWLTLWVGSLLLFDLALVPIWPLLDTVVSFSLFLSDAAPDGQHRNAEVIIPVKLSSEGRGLWSDAPYPMLTKKTPTCLRCSGGVLVNARDPELGDGRGHYVGVGWGHVKVGLSFKECPETPQGLIAMFYASLSGSFINVPHVRPRRGLVPSELLSFSSVIHELYSHDLVSFHTNSSHILLDPGVLVMERTRPLPPPSLLPCKRPLPRYKSDPVVEPPPKCVRVKPPPKCVRVKPPPKCVRVKPPPKRVRVEPPPKRVRFDLDILLDEDVVMNDLTPVDPITGVPQLEQKTPDNQGEPEAESVKVNAR